MSSDFDPYRVWLSIPAEEQPANYYRLLGVELFESDDEVIISAADRQITHVRTFQSGQYSEQARQILKELAAAQVTLLNKTKKIKYDAQLRSTLNTSSDPQIADTIVVELPPPLPQPLSSNKSEVKHKQKNAVKAIKKNSDASLTPFLVVLLLAMVLELFLFAGFFFIYRSKQPTTADVYLAKAKGLYNQSIELENEKKYSEALNKIIAVCELAPQNEEFESARQRVQTMVEESQLFAGARKAYIVDGVEFAFRWCPHGTFTMGSPISEKGHNNREIQHEVTLTHGFWMLETEITVGMFKAFVNDTGYESKGNIPVEWIGGWKENSDYSWRNSGFRQDDNHPVVCISWDDSVAFCDWLSKKIGRKIQLPTEAQWEYACRAGTTGAFAGNINEMGWYYDNSSIKTHPVGKMTPNSWGLFDMHGNVAEWCQDWSGKVSSESVTDPAGPSTGSKRISRGGNYKCVAIDCRSAATGQFSIFVPEFRYRGLGARCIIQDCSGSVSLTTQASAATDEK